MPSSKKHFNTTEDESESNSGDGYCRDGQQCKLMTVITLDESCLSSEMRWSEQWKDRMTTLNC